MKKIIKLYLIPILILCIAIGAIKILTIMNNKNTINTNNENVTQQIIIENENNIVEEVPSSTIENLKEELIIQEEPITTMYTTTSVNIRKGPSLDSEIFQTLPINSELYKVKVDENNWAEIKINNERYYVYNDYLSDQKKEIKISSRGESYKRVEDQQPISNSNSLGIYTLTAYCGCSKCCGKSTGITASGARATANHTIAAPSNFKFGTKLKINGQVYTVEDRGGAIKGNRIDIYFNSHNEALAFGRQQSEVFLVQ